jgi:hypothetical protein
LSSWTSVNLLLEVEILSTNSWELQSAQIESARLVKRNWTKVGFYVDFEVSRDASPLNLNDFGGHWPISGPQLRSADIQFGGGSILWGKDGRANCIEMYAHGDFFNEDVRVFELGPDQ